VLTLDERRCRWMTQPLREVCGPNSVADTKQLIDGMMMDGAMYSNPRPSNLSTARYDVQFAAKMVALEEAQALYHGMNGGEVCAISRFPPARHPTNLTVLLSVWILSFELGVTGGKRRVLLHFHLLLEILL
jgi:hypothetical protein